MIPLFFSSPVPGRSVVFPGEKQFGTSREVPNLLSTVRFASGEIPRLLPSTAGTSRELGGRVATSSVSSREVRPHTFHPAGAALGPARYSAGRGTSAAIGRTRSSGRISHVGSGTSSSS